MKGMTSKMNILLILSFLILVSCKKEQKTLPTELPPLTTVGKNTFGCLINNEIYVPEIRRQSLSIPINLEFPTYPSYNFSVTTLRLVNEQEDNLMDAEVDFYLTSIKDTGKYNIMYSSVKYNNKYYHSDSLSYGTLEIIKLDTINKIISGSFYFNTFDKDSNIIYITKGRFDLKK